MAEADKRPINNFIFYKVEQSPSSVSVSLVSSQSLPEVVFNQPMPDFYPCLRLLKFIENQKKLIKQNSDLCTKSVLLYFFLFSLFVQHLRSKPWTYKSKDFLFFFHSVLNFYLRCFKSNFDAVKSKFSLFTRPEKILTLLASWYFHRKPTAKRGNISVRKVLYITKKQALKAV